MSLFNKKYHFLYFLLFLHATSLSSVSIIIQSFLILFHFCFKKNIDFYFIFLCLLPNIALRSNLEQDLYFDDSTLVNWIKFYVNNLTPVLILGPIAFSPKFLALFGVLYRIFNYRNLSVPIFIFWCTSLIIVCVTLFLAYSSNTFSSGGLTIGLRILLTSGVFFLPILTDEHKMKLEIFNILKISSLLFLSGLLNEHWIFVFCGLISVFFFYKYSYKYRLISFLVFLIFIFFNFTFTIKLTLLLSIFFSVFINFKKNTLSFSRISSFTLVFSPLLLLSLSLFGFLDYIFLSFDIQELSSKFIEDRLPIWLATYKIINESNFFYVLPGRNIILFDYGIKGEVVWGAGAHNIFLESIRQIGLYGSMVIYFLYFTILYDLIYNINKYNLFFKYLIFSMFSVFMFYGLTGNSLIYDGVGFLFWLILSQLQKLSIQS